VAQPLLSVPASYRCIPLHRQEWVPVPQMPTHHLPANLVGY